MFYLAHSRGWLGNASRKGDLHSPCQPFYQPVEPAVEAGAIALLHPCSSDQRRIRCAVVGILGRTGWPPAAFGGDQIHRAASVDPNGQSAWK